jgi:hypothetical protein
VRVVGRVSISVWRVEIQRSLEVAIGILGGYLCKIFVRRGRRGDEDWAKSLFSVSRSWRVDCKLLLEFVPLVWLKY